MIAGFCTKSSLDIISNFALKACLERTEERTGPKAPRPPAAARTPLQVTVAKLADQIIVREDADIDRIGEAVAKRVVQAARNMAPTEGAEE